MFYHRPSQAFLIPIVVETYLHEVALLLWLAALLQELIKR